MNHPLHISFDLWNTIIASNRAFKEARSALFRDYFGLSAPVEEITKAFYSINHLANQVNNAACLCLDATELYMLVLDRTGGIPAGVTAAQLDEFYSLAEDLFLNQAPPYLLNPEAGAEITALRSRGITTSILSNTAFMKGRSLQKLLHQLRLTDCFDFMLFSDDINCSKPGITAFELLYQKAAALHNGRLTGPHQILHLGDDALTDVQGAVNAGMNGVLYTPPQSFVGLIEKK